MLLTFVGGSALEGAAKLVEAAGKGTLSFIAFIVLVVAFIFYRWFGREKLWVRGVASSAMIACIFAWIFILAVPKPSSPEPVPPPHLTPDPTPPKPVAIAPQPVVTLCSHTRDVDFRPQDPGVMPMENGHHIAMGDGGGGTTLEKWVTNWTAPGTVTDVECRLGGYQHFVGKNMDGTNAQCIGTINGGNDAIVMHVTYQTPCQ